ncbi:hypothetical protein RvY_08884 [Ramazzottius varieornatus]|uniref:DDE Tnp4 domain-containing protein n=1 Tax=Ramazzottius varieornatus TaxID=947166 RepID=A0A1D1VGL5_RAMVA|nr:hypothetical protein RvY_08884 [Ramazzottius varieornatus]
MELLNDQIDPVRVTVMILASSLRPPEPDTRNALSDSQTFAAAELACMILNNCAVASSSLSPLNHNLYVREVRAYGLLRSREIFSRDADMKKVFGVKRQTFSRILRHVRTRLQTGKDSPFGRPKFSAKLQLACGLHYLSKGVFYSVCLGTFGIGKSTAHKYVNKFILAVKHTYPNVIRIPSCAKLDTMVQRTMNKFRRFPEVQGTGRVLGAVDGTHINCPAPDNKREEYINRRRKYSLNVQGLVYPDCLDKIKHIILCCMILHNLCIDMDDHTEVQLNVELLDEAILEPDEAADKREIQEKFFGNLMGDNMS